MMNDAARQDLSGDGVRWLPFRVLIVTPWLGRSVGFRVGNRLAPPHALV